MSLFRESGGAYMVKTYCRSAIRVDGLACGCYADSMMYEAYKINEGHYCWNPRCAGGEARLRRLIQPGTSKEECESDSVTSKFQCQQVGCCTWREGKCRAANAGNEGEMCDRPQEPAQLPERPKAEEICEKQWSEGVCSMLGCCEWDSESGQCGAAHDGQCEPTGKDICEGYGFSEDFCVHNPCCKWSEAQGECKSAGNYCHHHPTSWSPENIRDFLHPAEKYIGKIRNI